MVFFLLEFVNAFPKRPDSRSLMFHAAGRGISIMGIIEYIIDRLLCLAIPLLPFGVWKVIEIVVLFCSHVSVGWK